jgi:hypothetical protein
MSDFLLLYEGGDHEWMKGRSPAEIQDVMQEWGAWFKQLESSGHLRNPGAALKPGGSVLARNGKSITTDAVMSELKELVGGFSIVQAGSLSEAAKIAEGSPFLKNNPDGKIVIRPVFEPQA